jgi:hypothetical protein
MIPNVGALRERQLLDKNALEVYIVDAEDVTTGPGSQRAGRAKRRRDIGRNI